MIQIIWDTRGYLFWLLLISVLCWMLERLFPWRPQQKVLRRQFGQDIFWLIFNGHYAGVVLAAIVSWAVNGLSKLWWSQDIGQLLDLELLKQSPLWLQFVVFLVLKDFLEWGVHNLLHRVSWLWQFHKLHHSIVELDWIGNMRFHWMEIVVYRGVTYFPLFLLGVDQRVVLWIAVFSTLIGHLNHSNLNVGWGWLGYVLNSPRLHIWHHDVVLHKPGGQNFGVIFSFWDFLFHTAYYPEGIPRQLGFEGMEQFPKNVGWRLLYPFVKSRPERP